ncbi:uncharacterized protein LOC130770943 [Actinidia eriantha]|uniref:uncharacterized protein LOC130770943 n=1 Tax=Actinidia eriantha TaxID=165200 RepID=UPI00258CD081|nr:uncharacterized protein LOC130770943 [Actinidia eriantha]
MYEGFSIQSLVKKPRQMAFELGSITFTKADPERVQHPHVDLPVIQLRMNNYDSNLKPARASLIGFNAQSYWPLGTITLKVRVGSQELVTEFVIVDIPSPYNAIVGRDWLHMIKEVASILHQVIKFVNLRGEEILYGNQVTAKQC